MEWILLLRLLFAHIVCDFILQSDKMVKAKCSTNNAEKTQALVAHSLLHAVAAYIAVWQWQLWYVPIVMFVTHLGIDWIKSSKKGRLNSFFIDQLLHLLIIVFLWLLVTKQFTPFGQWITIQAAEPKCWLVVIAYLLVTKPASIIISLFIGRWMPETKEDNKPSQDGVLTNKESESLEKAGMWIGYLERTLTLTFILLGQFAAVGFLLAAKSIFRIGDLKPGKDFKLTEYVLIGTFSSFFVAIMTGIVIKVTI